MFYKYMNLINQPIEKLNYYTFEHCKSCSLMVWAIQTYQ